MGSKKQRSLITTLATAYFQHKVSSCRPGSWDSRNHDVKKQELVLYVRLRTGGRQAFHCLNIDVFSRKYNWSGPLHAKQQMSVADESRNLMTATGANTIVAKIAVISGHPCGRRCELSTPFDTLRRSHPCPSRGRTLAKALRNAGFCIWIAMSHMKQKAQSRA